MKENNGNDLISRQNALDEIHRVYEYEFPTASGAFDEFVMKMIPNILQNLPSSEPERKIIHCKDCKFYTSMNRILKTGICSMTMHHLGDDGFCSTAEKRGE